MAEALVSSILTTFKVAPLPFTEAAKSASITLKAPFELGAKFGSFIGRSVYRRKPYEVQNQSLSMILHPNETREDKEVRQRKIELWTTAGTILGTIGLVISLPLTPVALVVGGIRGLAKSLAGAPGYIHKHYSKTKQPETMPKEVKPSLYSEKPGFEKIYSLMRDHAEHSGYTLKVKDPFCELDMLGHTIGRLHVDQLYEGEETHRFKMIVSDLVDRNILRLVPNDNNCLELYSYEYPDAPFHIGTLKHKAASIKRKKILKPLRRHTIKKALASQRFGLMVTGNKTTLIFNNKPLGDIPSKTLGNGSFGSKLEKAINHLI